MNQQNIQHSVFLAAILKISKTHSCKSSSSVKQGQVQWSLEKVPLMESLLTWRYLCFVTLLCWSLWLSVFYPSLPPSATARQELPICSRVREPFSSGRLAPGTKSWSLRQIIIISFPLPVIGLRISMGFLILQRELLEGSPCSSKGRQRKMFLLRPLDTVLWGQDA